MFYSINCAIQLQNRKWMRNKELPDSSKINVPVT